MYKHFLNTDYDTNFTVRSLSPFVYEDTAQIKYYVIILMCNI